MAGYTEIYYWSGDGCSSSRVHTHFGYIYKYRAQRVQTRLCAPPTHIYACIMQMCCVCVCGNTLCCCCIYIRVFKEDWREMDDLYAYCTFHLLSKMYLIQNILDLLNLHFGINIYWHADVVQCTAAKNLEKNCLVVLLRQFMLNRSYIQFSNYL